MAKLIEKTMAKPMEKTMDTKPMLSSKTLLEHIGRGVLGVAAIALAIKMTALSFVASLVLMALALFAFRGCPVCWTIGLVGTCQQRLKRTKPAHTPK
jgi:hypothetical protein